MPNFSADDCLGQLKDLINLTGVKPVFEAEFVRSLYVACLKKGPDYHSKLDRIIRVTDIIPDDAIITRLLLDKEFSAPVPVPAPDQLLNEHFSDPRNKTLAEYKRICNIFDCDRYFEAILAKLENTQCRGSEEEIINLLAVMGLQSKIKNNETRYTAIKKKLMGFPKSDDPKITNALEKAFGEFINRGDTELCAQFASCLSKDKYFTPQQEIVLGTFLRIDDLTANKSLLALLIAPDVSLKIKAIILDKFLDRERSNFFPHQVYAWASKMRNAQDANFLWEDLKYFQETLKIPSADLRKKLIENLDKLFGIFLKDGTSPAHVQSSRFESIPPDVFLALWRFVEGNPTVAIVGSKRPGRRALPGIDDLTFKKGRQPYNPEGIPELLEKFNKLYRGKIGRLEREALLFGIVNAFSIHEGILKKINERLGEIEFGSAGMAAQLGSLLKAAYFLSVVSHEGKISEKDLSCLDVPCETIDELSERLKNVLVRKIKEIFPREGITVDLIQALLDHWGNLDPIFVYAGKLADYNESVLNYLAEMVEHMDPPTYQKWKSWRYDLTHKTVLNQIGCLSSEQLKIFKKDYFFELGTVRIATTSNCIPQQIVDNIANALKNGHVYNPEMPATLKYGQISEILGLLYIDILKHPDERETRLGLEMGKLQVDLGIIDALIRHSNLPKLQGALELLAPGNPIKSNAKTKSAIASLKQFLSGDAFEKMTAALVSQQEGGFPSTEASIPKPVEVELCAAVEKIESEYATALKSNVLDRYGLSQEQVKDVRSLYEKRKELLALLDLYRISALNVTKIATNRVSEDVDGGGEALRTVINRLLTYFKDSAFEQDIQNIKDLVARREDLGSNRHLAMIVTDDPLMSLQVGKYPTGCGSCQNFEGNVEYNVALAGYVGDAHTKCCFLIDLNKLPRDIQADIAKNGFEETKWSIPPQDLLEASLARAVVKLVKDTTSGQPALFVEPTYSPVNKEDFNMNPLLDLFLKYTLSNPMRIDLMRGAGEKRVFVAGSRNPGGQYEDCAAGNAGNAGLGILPEGVGYPMFAHRV